MRRRRLGHRVTAAMVVVLTAVVFTPSLAAASPIDEARMQLWLIVNQADAHNQNVLNQFASAASAAQTVEELDDAYGIGYNSLEAKWYQANAAIDLIVDEFPELQPDAANAKAQLLEDHNGAHHEMDSLYDLVYTNLVSSTSTTTSTTTTQPPSTTSTSSTTTTSTSTTSTTVARSTTTTTTRPADSTTTTRPPETTTTTTAETTTTTLPATTTTTTPATSGIGDPSSGSGGASGSPSVGDDPAAASDRAAFSPSGTVMTDSMQAAADEFRHNATPAMAMVMERAAIVLPPGLVELAAPLVAFEFLLRAFFDSVGTMLIPFLTLLAAAAWMFWRESRRSRPVPT